MYTSRPSTLRSVLPLVPWTHWSPAVRIAVALVAVIGLAIFMWLFLPDANLMWGMVLTVPTVALGLSGGLLLGAAAGLAMTFVPDLVALGFGVELVREVPTAVAAAIVFTGLGGVVGYVAALTISHRNALAEIQQLQGILPMCAHCRRIRDDQGYWSAVEDYVSRHSHVVFSHGLCDDCLHEHYPEHAEAVTADRVKRKPSNRGSRNG